MRICVIAPVLIPVLGKTQRYGGIELVVALVTEELVKRGHEVFLLASGDSKTSAQLIPVIKKALGQRSTWDIRKKFNRLSYKKALELNPDVIWDHTEAVHAQTFREYKARFHFEADIVLKPRYLIDNGNIPIVQTIHGPAKYHLPGIMRALSNAGHFFVTISRDQEKDFKKFIKKSQHLGTVHNSVDTSFYKVNPDKKGDYLLWVGRYCMEKGAHIALEAAHRAEMPITLLGKLVEKHERKYFKNFIKPRLRPGDIVLGLVSAGKKAKTYENAYATLMTNLWEEPFGLVAVESMAAGTPVIAPSLGSLPEVLGDTGVLINVDDLNLNEREPEITSGQLKYIERVAKSIPKAKKIKPKLIRERVEKLFSVKHQTDGYEKMFKKAIWLKKENP